MIALLAVLLRLQSLPRRAGFSPGAHHAGFAPGAHHAGFAPGAHHAGLDDRATVLALLARFVDELGSGLLVVLVPTLRARLGLTVGQVGWCFQALASAGALVEPLAAAAVDLVRRRPLLVVGAAGWGTALLLTAAAPTFGWLLAAFALAGAAYGPLVNTADVVLVEGYPDAVERISARATMVDTVGALLAPAAVAVGAWAGADSRVLLGVAGAGTIAYAVGLAGSWMPPPPGASAPSDLATGSTTVARTETRSGAGIARSAAGAARRMARNLLDVLSDRRARLTVGALLAFEVLDAPEVFEPVWLRDTLGLGQAMIAVHAAVGLLGGLVGLLVLDRWLTGRHVTRLLVGSAVASVVLQPAWVLVPGVAAKLVLIAGRHAAAVPLWTVLRGRALAAVPGRAGAVAAVLSLAGFLPLHAGFGWLAGRVGLTRGLLAVHAVAALSLLVVLVRLVRDPPDRGG